MAKTGIFGIQYDNDTKKFNAMANDTIKCKCGHSVLLGKNKRIICTFCGRWVFKDKKDEFEYRLRERLRK